MIEDTLNDIKMRMGKSLTSLQQHFSTIRTGRAHPSLIEQLSIECYDAEMPLAQLATIVVSDASTLTVNAYDKGAVEPIEKAIINSNLGLNPVVVGDIIRVPLPSLTEERRKELVRVVRAEAEKTKVAIRNIRRDGNQILKTMIKEKTISEDDERRAHEQIQDLTDSKIKEVDTLLSQKEKEIVEI